MERIRLTKREKRVLKTLHRQDFTALSEFDTASVRSLSTHGLVHAAYIEGGGIEDAKLTNMGKAYMQLNPKLRNPVNWPAVLSIAALTFAVAVLILRLLTH